MFARLLFSAFRSLLATLVFVGVALGTVSVSAAADNGEELLTQAVAHAGDKEITTAEFRYKLIVTEQPPTKEMIARRTEEIREGLREDIKKLGDNEDLRRRYQKAIDTADEYVPPQLIQNASRTMTYYFVLGGPTLGSDHYVEFSILDLESRKFGPASTVLQRFLGAGDGVSLHLDGANGIAVAGRNDVYAGSQEPQTLGRLTGLLGGIAASPKFAGGLPFGEIITNVEVARVEGTETTAIREVTCRVNGSGSPAARIRCQIDPTRGYITPLVQELDAEGNMLREWVSSDYFRAGGTDLWFPKLCVYREKSNKGADAMPRTERYEFSEDGVMLNVEIPAERFAITLYRGNTLLDARKGENINYRASQELAVSLDDLDDIQGVAGLNFIDPNTLRATGKPAEIESSARIWLIAVNLVVVGALLAWMLMRRARRASAMIALGLSLATASGCGKLAGQSAETGSPGINVAPSQIDLGEIVTGGSEVTMSVRVENSSQQDVGIQIHPSCGCTTLDSDEFVLPAGAVREVVVAMQTGRRTGDFRGTLRVTASAVNSDEAVQDIVVPILARFRDDWSCRPRRVMLFVDRSGIPTGMLSISAPAEAWMGAEMDVDDAGIEVAVTSSQSEGPVETRNYRIVATAVSDGNYALSFRRREQERPFLVVPVLVRTNRSLAEEVASP